MHKPNKCIIDNWSLTHAGFLLEDSSDLTNKDNNSLIRNLGGLSNFINALLLYEESFFIVNTFESHWKKFKWFDKNASAFIAGVELDELIINWTDKAAYENKGIGNYLLTSRFFGSDLLVTPERSEEISVNHIGFDNTFFETLQKIDKQILDERDSSDFSKIKIGIDSNFQFPSIMQYVLSEATNREDLLKVIMQLKSDGKIRRVIEKIEEITSTTKEAGKFIDDTEELVKKAFGRKIHSGNSSSISLSAFGLSISKTINPNYFRRKEHLVFLKNLIACRSEAYRLEKDIQRIFKKKMKS
jgi:hypothetical protein